MSVFAAIALQSMAVQVAPETSPASPAAVIAVSPDDKMICKRKQKSSSLAAFERVCLTKREWDLQREQNREDLAARQGSSGWAHTIVNGGVPGN